MTDIDRLDKSNKPITRTRVAVYDLTGRMLGRYAIHEEDGRFFYIGDPKRNEPEKVFLRPNWEKCRVGSFVVLDVEPDPRARAEEAELRASGFDPHSGRYVNDARRNDVGFPQSVEEQLVEGTYYSPPGIPRKSAEPGTRKPNTRVW